MLLAIGRPETAFGRQGGRNSDEAIMKQNGLRKRGAVPAMGVALALMMSSSVSAQSVDPDRINRIEAYMRTLTGQVEELTHKVSQLEDQLKRMQEDYEFRFRDLEGGGGAPPQQRSEAPAAERGPAVAEAPAMSGGGMGDAIGSIAGEGGGNLGAPPEPLGTLTMDASQPGFDRPIDLSAPPPAGPDVAMVSPSGDPRSDYNRAYNLILSGDYDQAELGFRQFLEAYPDDALAADAQYWLGESLFVRAQFREAANEFLTGYKSYPKSGKAPDALLKLGLSLAGLGEREAACSTYSAVLKQYPDISNAMRQRVKVEQASASC